MSQSTHDPDLAALGQTLNDHPQLRQAALSGMAGAIKSHLESSGIQANASTIAGLGKLTQIGQSGNPAADDYVVRGVSSVVAAVKIRPSDILQHGVEAVRQLEAGGD